MGTIELTARNAGLSDLTRVLQDQRLRRLDVIATADRLAARDANMVISGLQHMDAEGVTTVDGTYRPTATFDRGLAEKLLIPGKYLARLRAERPDLYDANVNGLLHGFDGSEQQGTVPPDSRKFMLRLLRGDDETEGVARAFLSDAYGIIDNLDVLVATLEGVRQSGAEIVIDACDLSEQRMYVKVHSPDMAALAPTLLKGYRNPFDNGQERLAGMRVERGGWTIPRALQAAAREGQGYPEGQEPVVFAGFVISNSEVGAGAFTLTPRFVFRICKNGLTIAADALRSIHLGGRQAEGRISWSDDTQAKQLAYITAQARDAVKAFLNPDYVTRVIADLEAKAGVAVKDAASVITEVVKGTAIPAGLEADVLAHFIAGGQLTAGGVMSAVTSVAQTVEDADLAADLEAEATKALAVAARVG